MVDELTKVSAVWSQKSRVLWGSIRAKQEYFAAVQAGMDYNYAPMESIFRTVLARTLRQE